MMYKFVLFVALLGYRVHGQVIGTCSSLIANTTNCLGNNPLPTTDYPPAGKIDIGDVKDFFKTEEAIQKACNNEVKYRAAAKCIADSYRHCGDNDFKTLIPTGDQYDKAIEYVCEHENDAVHILNCMSDSYLDCTQNKLARGSYSSYLLSRSLPFSKHKEYYCGIAQIEDECVRDDIDVQACLGTEIYNKYVQFRNMLRPSACGASAIIFTTSLLLVSLIASIFH